MRRLARQQPTTSHQETSVTSSSSAHPNPATSHNYPTDKVLIDGGTTNHILKLEVYLKLRALAAIPSMTPFLPGQMTITFGSDSNLEPVLGCIEQSSLLAPIYVVRHLSQGALISEIEFTKRDGIILKDDTTLLIILNNQLVLHATRDPSAPAGANESLWLADMGHLFSKPSALPPGQGSHHARQLLQHVRQSSRTVHPESEAMDISHEGLNPSLPAQLVVSPPLSDTSLSTSEQPTSEQPTLPSCVTTCNQGAANSARPTFTQSEIRQGRSAIWGANGSAYRLANVLAAHALDNPPNIDPRLLRELGDRHDNPAYRMTHDLRQHPGGSGISSDIPGHTSSADIEGKWSTDRGLWVSYGLLLTDHATHFTKVYALDSKRTVRDALVLWANMWTLVGRTVHHVSFDYASEISASAIKHLNETINIEEALITIPTSSTTRSPHGIRVTKAPKEEFEKTIEAHWRSIRKDMSYALMNQDNLPQHHYWFWAFKHVAEMGNAFLNVCHPYMTPYERVFGTKPDAKRVLNMPWGQTGVCKHVKGNASGLDRVLDPSFDLAILIGTPLETANTYLVLLPGSTKPTEVTDMRPLEPQELRLTEGKWSNRAIQWDANGRIIGIPSTTPSAFTLRSVLDRFNDKRFHSIPEQQQSTLAEWKGRIRAGGGSTSKSARELSGRQLRSDVPIRKEQLASLVTRPTTTSTQESNDEGTSRVHRADIPVVNPPPPYIFDPPIPPIDQFPLPPKPFTTNHPEVLHPKPTATYYVNPVTNEMTLYFGLVAYYLPEASPKKTGLFRIHYFDKDYEDLTLA